MAKKPRLVPVTFDLYAEQPAECRALLPYKELDVPEYMKRILFLDPTPYYDRVRYDIDPYTRYNYISFEKLFPEDGIHCACGCGRLLTGHKNKKYETQDCKRVAIAIWTIIAGKSGYAKYVLYKYFGNANCKYFSECGSSSYDDIDHIIPIKYGGGACWLSNYQFLCKACHKKKTREDFNWKKLKTTLD